ncbi:MAG TPA: flagellar brake protein [Methyloradius sp.]
MAKPSDMSPIPKDSLRLGVPVPYPIYDAQGNLLVQAGITLKNQSQIDKLQALVLFQDKKYVAGATRSAKPGVTIESEKAPPKDTSTQLVYRDLKPGETLQLKPLADETGTVQYFVKYIGGIEKGSLICTLPIIDEKVMFIKENTGFSVRLFSGKNVYTFNTLVEIVYSRPYPHMHLKYPREVYTNKIRNNQRVTCNIIALVANTAAEQADSNKTSGRILDMSMGGIMFEATKIAGDANSKTETSFKVSMEGGEALFAIPGVLRNVIEKKNEDGSIIYQHGIQFGEIPFQQRVMLQNYIFQTLTGEKMDDF